MTKFLKTKNEIVLDKPININTFEIRSLSKAYTISLKLKNKNKQIIIGISQRNVKNNIITHQKYLTYDDISLIDLNYFVPFRNNISKLYKFMIRLFKANLVNIKTYDYDNSNLFLIFFCLKRNKNFLIQITIPSIDSSVGVEREETKREEENNKEKIGEEEKKGVQNKNLDEKSTIITTNNKRENDFDCAPIPFSMNNPNKVNNIFNYKLKKKNYHIYLYKNEYQYESKQYKEIVFKIIDKDDNYTIEYYAYQDLIDFLRLSETYYNLFSYSIDDIYDDFLIILYNHNFKLDVMNKKIRLFYNVYNLGKKANSELYYLLCININKFEKERTKEQIDFKINDYYIQIYKHIKAEEEEENKANKIKTKKVEEIILYDNIKNCEENINNENDKNSHKPDSDNNCEVNEKEKNEKKKGKRIVNLKNIKTVKEIEIKTLEENENNTDNEVTNNISLNEDDEKKNDNSQKKINKVNKNQIKNNNNISLNQKRKNNNSYIPIEFYFKPKKEQSLYLLNNSINIVNDNTLLNSDQLKLIINKAISADFSLNLKDKKIITKLVYEISLENYEIINTENIIKEIWEKINGIKNMILLIKTIKDIIFGGFNKNGFLLEKNSLNDNKDSDSFVFSINKMATYEVADKKEFCILYQKDKLPEFKEQITFEKNNIVVGFTGCKNKGYLVEDDFGLNNGEKQFNIKQIQFISLCVE